MKLAGKTGRDIYRAATGANRIAGSIDTVRTSVNTAVADAIRNSGVDLTDTDAVQAWAHDNRKTITQAVATGVSQIATDRLSATHAKALNQAFNNKLGDTGQEVMEKTFQRGADILLPKLFD